MEQIYRIGASGSRFRPFSESTHVKARGYSRNLQRAICDFGADHAFGQVNAKLQEHYGITVPSSASRHITEFHAHQMLVADNLHSPKQNMADIIIAESDGSMIPIVETQTIENTDQTKTDRRKNKKLFWKEARLSLAHAKDSVTPYFAATMGSVQEAGTQLLTCVNQVGAHEKTHVHCVGDGAVLGDNYLNRLTTIRIAGLK